MRRLALTQLRSSVVVAGFLLGGIAAHAADEAVGKPENSKKPPSLEDIKGGQLFRHGISVGYSAVAHAPIEGPQENLGVGSMPYVSFHPFTWERGDTTRVWCSARWAGRTSKESQDIANAVAEQKTKEKLEAKGKTLPTDREERRKAILDKKEGDGWDIDKGGAGCWKQWFGLYVGIPAAYKADVTFGPNTAFQEVNPRISSGLIFSPSVYLSLLAGVSYTRAAPEKAKSEGGWVFTTGAGASFELFSGLFGG